MDFSEILAKLQKFLEKKEQWYYDNPLEYGKAVKKGKDYEYVLKFVKSMNNLKTLVENGFIINYEAIANELCYTHLGNFVVEAYAAMEKNDIEARVVGERQAWQRAFNCKILLDHRLVPTDENKFLIYLQRLNHSLSKNQLLHVSVAILKGEVDVLDKSSWIYNPSLFPADDSISEIVKYS